MRKLIIGTLLAGCMGLLSVGAASSNPIQPSPAAAQDGSALVQLAHYPCYHDDEEEWEHCHHDWWSEHHHHCHHDHDFHI